MPLQKGSSEKAFEHNVSTEVQAGKAKGMSKEKAVKRALAISFDIKRARERKNRG